MGTGCVGVWVPELLTHQNPYIPSTHTRAQLYTHFVRLARHIARFTGLTIRPRPRSGYF